MMPNVSYFYLTSDVHICRNICKQLKHDGFVWPIDSTVTGRFVSNMEFVDLKVADPSVSTASLCSCVFLSMVGTTTISEW